MESLTFLLFSTCWADFVKRQDILVAYGLIFMDVFMLNCWCSVYPVVLILMIRTSGSVAKVWKMGLTVCLIIKIKEDF